MLHWIARWLPAIVWMAVIFFLSHQSSGELAPLLPFLQKGFPWLESLDFGHTIAYFLLACFVYWGMGARFFHFWGKCLAIAFCAVYGMTDEYHQMFVEGRQPDITDLRNDVIGAGLAMLLASLPPVHRKLSHWWNQVFSPSKKY